MDASGWIFMLTSVCGVTALTLWCFYRVITLPADQEDDLHAPLDIDTHENP